MKKGVIVDLKEQYTYVLCKNAKIKKIKRQYDHEIGKTIELPFLSLTRDMTTAFVVCLVVFAVVFNSFKGSTSIQALSYVSLSVNPGLVFKIDENQKVTAVSYTNKEGNEMTQKIDFINQSLDDCVILFIDYCFENHYFNTNKNIDINVMSDNNEEIQSLEKQINDTIQSYLKTHQITLSIAVDKVSENQEKDAKELGIPNSKLKLIDTIIKYYPHLNKKELAKKSIDDLIDYLEDQGFDEDVLDHLEDELEKEEEKQVQDKIISRDEAQKIALKKVNGKIKSIDYDDYEYEVEIVKNGVEYEIKINAVTGKVLEVEKD